MQKDGEANHEATAMAGAHESARAMPAMRPAGGESALPGLLNERGRPRGHLQKKETSMTTETNPLNADPLREMAEKLIREIHEKVQTAILPSPTNEINGTWTTARGPVSDEITVNCRYTLNGRECHFKHELTLSIFGSPEDRNKELEKMLLEFARQFLGNAGMLRDFYKAIQSNYL